LTYKNIFESFDENDDDDDDNDNNKDVNSVFIDIIDDDDKGALSNTLNSFFDDRSWQNKLERLGKNKMSRLLPRPVHT
jgi:hypothetical protein